MLTDFTCEFVEINDSLNMYLHIKTADSEKWLLAYSMGVWRSLKEKCWSLKWEYNYRVYYIDYGIIKVIYYAIIQHTGTYSSIVSRFLIPLEGHLMRKRSFYTLNYSLICFATVDLCSHADLWLKEILKCEIIHIVKS